MFEEPHVCKQAPVLPALRWLSVTHTGPQP